MSNDLKIVLIFFLVGYHTQGSLRFPESNFNWNVLIVWKKKKGGGTGAFVLLIDRYQ